MAFISCQIAHSSKVLMPWSIIFNFSTSCTFIELYNSIKNGQSAPDVWTFPEKYDITHFVLTVWQIKLWNENTTSSWKAERKKSDFLHKTYLYDLLFEHTAVVVPWMIVLILVIVDDIGCCEWFCSVFMMISISVLFCVSNFYKYFEVFNLNVE